MDEPISEYEWLFSAGLDPETRKKLDEIADEEGE